jgi:Putative DNA-binding domain
MTVAEPDFGRHARQPTERLAVVRYVLETENLQETDYLEWKSGYDLSSRPGAAATSKHLIGFANRDSTLASRHAGGHGYLLLGVEPRNLVGIPTWDSADVENWLVRFIGADLRYDIHYVTLDNKAVLFLTVDPPRQGDPIYCMEHTSTTPGGQTLPEGAIYVRRNGKTELAKPADVRRLTSRASSSEATLQLVMELDASELEVLEPGLVSESTLEAFVKQERERLYDALPEDSGFSGPPSFSDINEPRSRNEYVDQVDWYLGRLQTKWPRYVVFKYIEEERSKLTPILTNETDENFENVVVELTLPLPYPSVYAQADEPVDRYGSFDPPAPWGDGLSGRIGNLRSVLADRTPVPEIQERDKESCVLVFPAIHVRPRTSHRLQMLLVAPHPKLAGQTLTATWRATASNTRGDHHGEIELAIPAAG